MTIHSSLRGAGALTGRRSVLKRVERIQKLAKDGKFDEEQDSVWGLPKVRTQFKVVSAKKAKAAAEAAAAAEAGAEAGGEPEAADAEAGEGASS